MKPTIILAAILALSGAYAFAADVEIEGPDRVDEHRLVELTTAEADGFAWIIRRTGDGNRPDTAIVADGRRVIWTGRPGRYEVDLIVQSGGRLVQAFRVVEIGDAPEPDPDPEPGPGPGPGPDPEPSPNVPEDDFGNIGRRVAGWAQGLDGGPMVAERYSAAADALRSDPTVTIGDVGAKLSAEVREAVTIDQWADTFAKLNEDLQGRWPMSRGVLADYYDAVAVGLR